ncbi:unnamed protein product [Closterium sp. NIES-54]
MDGGSNYGAACKELMADWPHIEYVPCATHVVDLLMEDVGKIPWAKEIVDRCGDMITDVCNHHFTRNYLRSGAVKGRNGEAACEAGGDQVRHQIHRSLKAVPGAADVVSYGAEPGVRQLGDGDKEADGGYLPRPRHGRRVVDEGNIPRGALGASVQGDAGHGQLRERHDVHHL